MDHETSHSSPGFGTNTNGMGIFIVAAVLVLFALFAWNMWNDAGAEKQWYRIEKTTPAESHAH